MGSKEEYSCFAHLYDRFKSDDNYDLLVDILDHLGEEYLHTPCATTRTLWDMGTGTGAIARRFARRGWDVYASDVSSSMIDRARAHQKASSESPKYFVADCRERPSIPCQCDMILAIDDVVNCMRAKEDLIAMFSQAHGALKVEGIFIFDLVLRRAYKEYMKPVSLRKVDNTFFLTYPDFVDEPGCSKRAMKCITLLEQSHSADQWFKEEYTFSEYYHDIETICECLEFAGLKELACLELSEVPKKIDITSDTGEIYKVLFVCSTTKGGSYADRYH